MPQVSVSQDGYTITANGHADEAALKATLAAEAPPAEPSKPDAPPAPQKATEPPVEAPDEDDADDTTAAAIDPASEAGKQLAKKKQSLRDRIDDLTFKWRSTEREREQAREEAAQLRQKLATLEAGKTTQSSAPPADGKPRFKDYEARIGTDFAEYADAVQQHAEDLQEWKFAAERKASDADAAARTYQQALHQSHTRGRETHADFDAVLEQFVQQGGRLAPSPDQAGTPSPLADLSQTILQHPLGHSIAYAVAKDAELYQRLMRSPTPIAFYTEMGQLITRLTGATSGTPASPAPVSRAKPPIPPVGSSPVASASDPDDVPFDQLVKSDRKKSRGFR